MSTPTRKDIPLGRLKLGQKLRKLRAQIKWTQEEASAQAGINFTHYVRLESTRPNAVTIDTLEKLAKAFKTTPSKLLDF